MRRFVSASCLLLIVGCVGPHSSGALWAQQNLEQELVSGRQLDAERVAALHAYELALADESLTAERARLALAAQDCPGAARQLQLSPGDRTRDSIRLRIGDNALRQTAVAQLALIDWRMRRAHATGDARFCDDARLALAVPTAADGIAAISVTGSLNGQPSTDDPLAALGWATVARTPRGAGAVPDQAAMELSLSNYALGYTDTVRARAPLPQYLAAVYGGVLLDVDAPPALNIWVPSNQAFTAESAVDLLAPVYPQWEPDALFVALQSKQ
jgi:hypothetical protein